VSILSIYDFCLICYKKLLIANLLNWKHYSPFKIVYGLTILGLISLLADERVTHDGNRKTQVMKDCLRRHDNKMKKILGSMHSKQIKDEKGLSLN